MPSRLSYILSSLMEVIFPSSCACCGDTLVRGERQICLDCLTNLDQTLYSAQEDNPTERLLGGRIRFENATSLYYFRQGSTVQKMIHALKYHGNSELCILMGRQMGADLLHSGRFDDIDLLVPVPLHWRRKIERGYNQSELLCKGIGQVLGRQVESQTLRRHRYTRKQSLQGASGRVGNVADAFSVRHPERIAGKHILLVDDVLTTGATLGSCYDALSTVTGIKISIATLAIAIR